jgi:hypothetical protein
MLSANASAIARDMAGLSMTNPNSVLRCAERGSKLKDPTKTRARSTAMVLACRLDAELMASARLFQAGGADVRFISNNATPAFSSTGRRLT